MPAALADSVSFLRSLQERTLFMRASVMAQWPAAGERFHMERPAFEARYALLRHRLLDLEYDLWTEGRLPCPGHLLPTCPNCDEPDHQPSESLADYPDSEDAFVYPS